MSDYRTMSLEELLVHHDEIRRVLLQRVGLEVRVVRRRRPYPLVKPKFQNPENPLQTWSGRGRQPHWLVALLAKGNALEDLKIR
ncbi:H-NS histone family protein [Bradyrhizobium sp. SZCCHNG3015]|uniref:H-NS histone family protein n=1 Tax=Bradyrhizobium sp. SZCCHNG3015 TaxID=3057270 RepID=UPI0028E25DDE|nr:H-NS histone family protein [Bradyrhizobium sp. SZCCHNG3015]